MENLEKSLNEVKEKSNVEVKIDFSKENQVKQIKHHVDRLDWSKEQGYEITFPKKVQEIIDQGKIPTDEEIQESVVAEFDEKQYQEQAQKFQQEWVREKDKFLQKLKTLGLPLPEEYNMLLTKYGCGGSYGLPNNLQINFDFAEGKRTLTIAFHEMIHLTIENLIKKYKIKHWTKERLVDLIYGEFYPHDNEAHLQPDPEHSEKIKEIFKKYFPDIEKVIVEISSLGKK